HQGLEGQRPDRRAVRRRARSGGELFGEVAVATSEAGKTAVRGRGAQAGAGVGCGLDGVGRYPRPMGVDDRGGPPTASSGAGGRRRARAALGSPRPRPWSEVKAMSLQLPSTIWVATAPVNLRLSFDRLAGIVRAELGGDPKQPLLVMFHN